jgi:hypothetical protein
MSGEVTIKIRVGNAEMQTREHVGSLLEWVAALHLRRELIDYDGTTHITIPLFDLNGNTVGTYEYRRES